MSGFCTEDSFWISQPFVTKLDIVVHHCEPESVTVSTYLLNYWFFLQANFVFWYIIISQSVQRKDWGQGHSNEKRLVCLIERFVSNISSEQLIFLQPNLLGWYIIINWSVFLKYWIAVVKDWFDWLIDWFAELLIILQQNLTLMKRLYHCIQCQGHNCLNVTRRV